MSESPNLEAQHPAVISISQKASMVWLSVWMPASPRQPSSRLAQDQSDSVKAQQLREEFDCDDVGLMGTESVDIAFLQSDGIAKFWRHLQSVRCNNCQKPVKVDAAGLITRTKQMLKESHVLHPLFSCPNCHGWFCVGCNLFHGNPCVSYQEHVASARTFKSTWCCDQGRLFLIFCLLAGVDPPARQPVSQPAPAPTKAIFARSKAKSSTWMKPERGGLKLSQLPKGTGYGDGFVGRKSARGPAQPTASDNTDDLELYFQGLASLLPSTTKGIREFDSLPQPLVSAMISRSPMLQHASEILRRASIEDINTGPILAVIDFLETAGSHPDTLRALVRPRTIYPPTEQLISLALEQQKHPRAAELETTQSLAATFELLAVPCRKFLDSSRKLSNLEDEEGPKLLEAGQKICDVAGWLGSRHGELPTDESQETGQLSTSSAGQSRHSITSVATRGMTSSAAKPAEPVGSQEFCKASEWHRTNCVKEVLDETILKDFHYRSEALAAANLRPAPRRMKKLLAQVSSLSTDLPDGIYVRHGESRLDVLKVLIVGPVDTPYEHGLFEFDMWIPSEFPQSSPQMFFRTTAGGVIHFNPNLYPNGRVCLSLLGTWGGQGWEPDRSTILQILVSIQAMVFNDKPYHNEPGHEYHQPENYKTHIEQYNRNVEQKTADYAIIGWLTERLSSPQPPGTATSQVCSPKPSNMGTSTIQWNDDPTNHPGPDDIMLLEAFSTFESAVIAGHVHPEATIMQDVNLWVDMILSAPGTNNTAKPHQTPPNFQALPTPRAPRAPAASPRAPEGDDPIWGDVIRKHFELKGRLIVETVKKWESQALAAKRDSAAGRTTTFSLTGNIEGAGLRLLSELTRHGFVH